MFLLLGMALAYVTLAESGVRRVYYAGLGVLLVGFMIAHYRTERALVQDHQTAIAVVTEYRVRWKRTPHIWGGVPRIKYSE